MVEFQKLRNIIIGEDMSVLAKPTGEVVVYNISFGAPANFSSIVSYIVPSGRTFHLAKAELGTSYDADIRVYLGDDVVGIGQATQKTTWVDFYPYGTNITGDGTKTVSLKVKAGAGGDAASGLIQGMLV